MINSFRVRETDDNLVGRWVVASGPDFVSTRFYINADGEVIANCFVYKNKDSANAALKEYLGTTLKPEAPEMREFEGGATRDADNAKLDYEGFNNPLVDKCYASYLNKHRQTANGLRNSDNWQNLFGESHYDVCMKSLCRHAVDARLAHRKYESEQPLIDSLCGIIFNAKAYLLKLMLEEIAKGQNE